MEHGSPEGRASHHGPPGPTGTEALPAGASTVVASALLLALAVTMIAVALGYNPEARRLPILVGGPVAILATAELLTRLRQWKRSRAQGTPAFGRFSGRTWMPVAHFMAFVVIFATLGQTLGTWLFTLGFIRTQKALSWPGAVIMASVLAASVWGIARLLDVRTYGGIFGLPL